MEPITTLVLLEVATGIVAPKLLEYGVLGICVLALSWAVKVLHKRGDNLQDKLLEISNKNIEVNGKVANALQNNSDVLGELKKLMMDHIMEYKEDRHHD